MAKAFLSHSSADKVLVRQVQQVLGNKRCILDEKNFEPGALTLQEIFKNLDNSDVFVFFISENTLNSKWVKDEISRSRDDLKAEIIDRIYPIIIDKNITYNDVRIPVWMKHAYNIQPLLNVNVIIHKIKECLREVEFKKNPFNRQRESIFVGRNELLRKFERDILNLDNWTPSYIIAYSTYEGIGRRTFLKNALLRQQLISERSIPFVLTISSKESIENYIYKLNTKPEIDKIYNADMSKLSLEEKVEIAVQLTTYYMDRQVMIFIIDDAGIMLPNKQIVPWFDAMMADSRFNNNLALCVISRYSPNTTILESQHRALAYRIPELDKSDTQSLFMKLLKVYQHESLSREDKSLFLKHLKGIPSQVVYAVNLIDKDTIDARNNVVSIDEFSDLSSQTILNRLQENNMAYQLAIFLSTNDIFSITFVSSVFGDSLEVREALDLLYNYSVVNYLFGGYEYITLNSALRDYISRSNLKVADRYIGRRKAVVKTLLKKDPEIVLRNDYTEFMELIRGMLESGKTIPPKFFIPSLILKDALRFYSVGEYPKVVALCRKLLECENYDEQIIWQTRYLLVQALARDKDEDALKEIKYFSKDRIPFYFLMGFYYRMVDNQQRALGYLDQVLSLDRNHSKAKREKVNILLAEGQYENAMELARDNYTEQRTNIFHIQAYFLCLIRGKEYLTPEDCRLLKSLLEAAHRIQSAKAEDITRCMEGEYAYYVKGDLKKARDILEEAVKLNTNKLYPKKILALLLHRDKHPDLIQKYGFETEEYRFDSRDYD